MRALVVGLGNIGVRRALSLHYKGIEPVLCDAALSKITNLASIPELSDYPKYSSVVEAVGTEHGLDVGLICTPPSSHLDLASYVTRQKINVFVEKPLYNRWDEEMFSRLADDSQRMGVWVQLGFSYRHLSSLVAWRNSLPHRGLVAADLWAGQYRKDWHPGQQETLSRQENGIVLDSLSHSVDLVHWLFGKIHKVHSLVGSTGEFGKGIGDTVSMLCEMANGAAVTVHVDFWQQPRSNKISAVYSQKNGHFSWELKMAEIDAMYQEEVGSIIAAVVGGYAPQPDLAEGIRNMDLLDHVVRGDESLIEERWKTITHRN